MINIFPAIVLLVGILALGYIIISTMINNFRLIDEKGDLQILVESQKSAITTKEKWLIDEQKKNAYLRACILQLETMIKPEDKTCEFCEHHITNSGGACESGINETCDEFKLEVTE